MVELFKSVPIRADRGGGTPLPFILPANVDQATTASRRVRDLLPPR